MPRILIVDDSAVMRRNLEFTLKRAGHEIVGQAADGRQAYNLYKAHTPDLVTMDITMPEVNGIEGVKRIMQDFPEAKIIMVSALDQKEMVLEAVKFGAKHYILKPINTDNLLAVINKVLGSTPLTSHETAGKTENTLQLENRIRELEFSRKRLEEENIKLEQLSTLDGLTGIPNRRHFDNILDSGWKRAFREKVPVSLLMIDIDFFKNFNDSMGHLAGDECIKNVANLIAGNLKRASDIAARYGGEEFAVILPGIDGIGAFYIAECIRSSVEGARLAHPSSASSQYVTVSIGVAGAIPGHDTAVKDLVRMADEQLYLAKQQGRNKVAYNLDGEWESP